MSITGFVKTPKRIYRLSQIMQVLARHGFGYLVYNLRLHTHLPLLNRINEKSSNVDGTENTSLANRLTTVCQELGPTFVKLGQVLSTRPDIIPEHFIKELQSLQSDVKPFDSHIARSVIERDLGMPISEAFSAFDDVPIASGSIAQVHKANLIDGSEVVVKVKRPDIHSMIFNDMGILTYIAEQAEKIDEFRIYRPLMIVSEFTRKIERELDFVSEASSTARFYDNYKDDENVRTPRVYWDYCTHDILTIERFVFPTLTDVQCLDKMGVDRERLAADLVKLFMSQYLEKTLFHADPHPGNLMISADGDIAMIDFGMVGYVTAELKKQIVGAIVALSKKDFDLFADIFMDLGVVPASCDVQSFKLNLFEVMDKYYGIPLSNIDASNAFTDVMRVARDHDMILPREFVLLSKSFVTVVTIAKSLDPGLNFVDIVSPFTHGLFTEKLTIDNISKTAASSTWHFTNLLRQAPKEIRYILRKIVGGNMQIVMKHKGLENLITDLDKSSNRLALSIILSATVIGSSMIMMGKIGPMVMDNISILGIIGYLIATVMGFSLVVAIFRSGRL